MADAVNSSDPATGRADSSARPVGDLRLSTCPDCGYALAGLPDVGTCPECGSAYDRDDGLVLFGTGAGTLANASNQSSREIAKQAAWFLGLLVVQFYFYWRTRVATGLFAGLLLVQGVRLAFRAATWTTVDPRHTVRARLSRDGVRQDDLAPAAAFATRALATGTAIAVAAGGCWLFLQFDFGSIQGTGARATAYAVAALLLAGLVLLIFRSDLLVKAGEWLRFGSATARHGGGFHPWDNVDTAKLSLVSAGRYRLQIERRGSNLFDRTLVDAHIALTDEQVEVVRGWLQAYRPATA